MWLQAIVVKLYCHLYDTAWLRAFLLRKLQRACLTASTSVIGSALIVSVLVK